jgi:hypothetical protein
MRKLVYRQLAALAAVTILLSGCCFLRWFSRQATRPLTYFVHSGVPISWVAPINAAGNSWNGIFPMFTYGGIGGGGSFANDGVNSVFMTFFTNNNILAAVEPHGFCLLTDTDMGWNAARFDFNTNGADVDVQTVALHEFGHYGLLHHVICPSSSVMLPVYQGVRRSPSGCDGFGMFVSNVLTPCFAATGICFPSFFLFALNGFDALDQEDEQTVAPMAEHTEELIQIWQGNAALRSAADSVGELYANLALDYDNGHSSPWSQYFTAARYQELDQQVIAPIYASSSTPLRADLDALRAHLQSKIGLSLGSIFGGDLAEYPGNPGVPLEPQPSSTCKTCGGTTGGEEPPSEEQ